MGDGWNSFLLLLLHLTLLACALCTIPISLHYNIMIKGLASYVGGGSKGARNFSSLAKTGKRDLYNPNVTRGGPINRHANSGMTATVFGAYGSTGRYIVNELGEFTEDLSHNASMRNFFHNLFHCTYVLHLIWFLIVDMASIHVPTK